MTVPTTRVTCETGPAAGRAVLLGPGRHVVGRSRDAAVCVADPAVEAHHGLLDVTADGAGGVAVRFLQLTGRVPCRVDGGLISIGRSRLRIGERPPAADLITALATTHDDHWPDPLRRASLGWGRPAALEATVETERSVELDLEPGTVVTISGHGARAVARSVVLQLALRAGPDDWALSVLGAGASSWAWCRALPHASAASSDVASSIVVVDGPTGAAEDPVDDLLERGAIAAVVVQAGQDRPVHCGHHLELRSVGMARWRLADRPADPLTLHPAGVDERVAARVAQLLGARRWTWEALDGVRANMPVCANASSRSLRWEREPPRP